MLIPHITGGTKMGNWSTHRHPKKNMRACGEISRPRFKVPCRKALEGPPDRERFFCATLS
jgi:hypothetical protein